MSIESIVKDFLALFEAPAWSTFVALFSVFVYRKWREHVDSREKSKAERIERFLVKFPALPTENYAILVEQLFLDTFGKPLSYPEIQFFLKSSKPTEHIQQFLQARTFFDRSSLDGIRLKRQYSSITRLRFAKWHRNIWYTALASTGLLLTAYSEPVFSLAPPVWAVFAYLVFSLFLMAYLMLDASTAADAAINLSRALPELSKPDNSVNRAPERRRFSGAFRALRFGDGYVKRQISQSHSRNRGAR